MNPFILTLAIVGAVLAFNIFMIRWFMNMTAIRDAQGDAAAQAVAQTPGLAKAA